jgi:hypothetical protein
MYHRSKHRQTHRNSTSPGNRINLLGHLANHQTHQLEPPQTLGRLCRAHPPPRPLEQWPDSGSPKHTCSEHVVGCELRPKPWRTRVLVCKRPPSTSSQQLGSAAKAWTSAASASTNPPFTHLFLTHTPCAVRVNLQGLLCALHWHHHRGLVHVDTAGLPTGQTPLPTWQCPVVTPACGAC